MPFDRECNAGVFVERFSHWIPKPELLSFNQAYRLRASRVRKYLGWIPIVVWRGRSFSRANTYGILRQRATAKIDARWEALKQRVLIPRALDGRVMQGILLSSRHLNAALRVEPPTADGFIYHIKYKIARRHGIYMQREVNLRDRIVLHHLIHSTKPGEGFAREMMRKSVEFYDSLGIKEVRLVAGLSLGGAMWAQFGFRPINTQEWDNCKERIIENTETLSQMPSNKAILGRHQAAIDDAVAAPDPRAIWSITALQEEVTTVAGRVTKLGQALLLGARWHGVMDLTDQNVRFILRSELGVR